MLDVLAAEAAAHELTHDLHAVERQVQIPGEAVPGDVYRGRRGPDLELVPFPHGHAGTRLHLRVVDVRGPVGLFQGDICFGQTLLDIAGPLDLGLAEDQVARLVDQGGIGLQRLLGIEHERQLFVHDLDQTGGFPRRITIDGGNRGHCFSREADRIVKHPALELRALDFLVPIALPDAAVPAHLRVLVVNHGQHAR